MSTKNGNGKSEKKAPKGAVAAVAAAVVAAMVRTMDGTEIAADKAIALARGGLVAYKHAAPGGSKIAGMLDGMIATYDVKGPDAFVFASEDSPKAKQLVGVLGSMRVKEGTKLFVSLLEERTRREEYLKSRGEKVEAQKQTSEKAAADAQAKMEEEATKRAARTAEKLAKDAAGAAFLETFVDKDAVATKKNVHSEREATRALRESRIKPFALGQATVVLGERGPTSLRAVLADGTVYEVPVAYFQDLQAYSEKLLKGMAPKDIPVTCSFCEEDMHLGDVRPPRDAKDRPLAAVVQIGFEARTPDGRNVWSYKFGPKNGKPRYQNILACNWCGSAARALGPKTEIPDNRAKQEEGKPPVMRTVPAIRTQGLYEAYYAWVQDPGNHYVGDTDEVVKVRGTDNVVVETTRPVMAAGPAPALTSRPFDASNLAAAAEAVGKSGK